MKKRVVLFMALVIALVLAPAVSAKYRTYEVVEVTEKTVTIKDKDGKVLVLEKDPKDFKAGDIVRYDSKRNRLRKKKESED